MASKSKFMIIQALKNYRGDRFPVEAGDLRRVRYGYDRPDFIPNIVSQARAGEQIDWGGATVLADGYRVLFDGPGPLPPELDNKAPRPHHKTPYPATLASI